MVDVPDGLLDRGVDLDIEDPRWRATQELPVHSSRPEAH